MQNKRKSMQTDKRNQTNYQNNAKSAMHLNEK